MWRLFWKWTVKQKKNIFKFSIRPKKNFIFRQHSLQIFFSAFLWEEIFKERKLSIMLWRFLADFHYGKKIRMCPILYDPKGDEYIKDLVIKYFRSLFFISIVDTVFTNSLIYFAITTLSSIPRPSLLHYNYNL